MHAHDLIHRLRRLSDIPAALNREESSVGQVVVFHEREVIEGMEAYEKHLAATADRPMKVEDGPSFDLEECPNGDEAREEVQKTVKVYGENESCR